MTSPHSIEAEYDLIFVGGGTTACITASRLAAAFPDLTILVLESGPTTRDKKEHNRSTASDHVAGRSVVVPSGRCVGGGSSVNFMLYNRPAASDFDDWENLETLAETYEIDPKKHTHGSAGPLKVSFGGEILDIGKQFLELGPRFEKDRPRSDEGNGLDLVSINAFFQMPKWISSDGRRSDVAHHYIYDKNFKNLSVLDGCLVDRVMFKNGVATGVGYLFDKRVYEAASQDMHIVKARKLVVVSAETTTLDSLFRREPETLGRIEAQWDKDGTGLLGTNCADSAIKMRPHPEELPELGPDFTKYWNDVFANKPDMPLFWLGAFPGLPIDQSSLPPLKFLCSGCFLVIIEQFHGYVRIE
ncbi:GMC oxidoreductase-domain-containing protein [Mycena latifolia]|nr:GMC oxidoreductase-domain-containing protein [Mycena latifolia]